MNLIIIVVVIENAEQKDRRLDILDKKNNKNNVKLDVFICMPVDLMIICGSQFFSRTKIKHFKFFFVSLYTLLYILNLKS